MGWITDGLRAVGQFFVKATEVIVDTTIKIVKEVVKKAVEVTLYIYGVAVQAVEYIVIKTIEGAVKIIEGFVELKERIKAIFNKKDIQYTEYQEVIDNVNETQEQLKGAKSKLEREATPNKKAINEIENALSDTEKVKVETEKAYNLKKLHDSLIELIEYANSIESDERMRDIQNLARLQVSTSFLNGVVTRGEMITVEEKEFINLTKKFLYDEIKDPELERFDLLIYEREGRSLLSIGNEYIYKLYIDQQSELEGKRNEKQETLEFVKKELRTLKRNIKFKNEGWEKDESKIASLERRIGVYEEDFEIVKQHLHETSMMLYSIEGIQFIFDNEGNSSIPDFIVSDSKEVCELFVKFNQTKSRPNEAELIKIEEFGRVVRGYKISNEGEITTTI